MRHPRIAGPAVLAALLLLVRLGHAEESPAKKSKKSKKPAPDAVLVASLDPLPSLPPPVAPVESAPPPAKPAETPAAPKPAAARPLVGQTFELSAGLRYVRGAIGDLSPTFDAFGFALGARGGYYVSPHVGILGGFQASLGSMGQGCSGDANADCKALSFELPVVVQYAVENRNHGPYLEGGLSFMNLQALYADAGSVGMLSPVDLTAGAGYRFALGVGADKTVGDVGLHTTLGQYTSAWSIGDDSGSVSIPSSHRSLHGSMTVAMSFGF